MIVAKIHSQMEYLRCGSTMDDGRCPSAGRTDLSLGLAWDCGADRGGRLTNVNKTSKSFTRDERILDTRDHRKIRTKCRADLEITSESTSRRSVFDTSLNHPQCQGYVRARMELFDLYNHAQ